MSERSYKTAALVLRARNLGEADRIFTLFTQASGKVDAVGKGVRRPKSRLGGRLEFGNEVALGIHRGRSLDVIVDADLIVAHSTALLAPERFAAAHVVVELVDAFCELELALPDVYALLRGALRAVGEVADPVTLVPRFELRLLGALGFGPQTEACVHCGEALGAIPAWADLEAGGLACERCRPHRADALALAAEDVANFRSLAAPPRGALRPTARATVAAARAIDAFVTWHLGKRLTSSKYLGDLALR